MYYRVALFGQSFDDEGFVYFYEEPLCVGMIISAPLLGKELYGVIVEVIGDTFGGGYEVKNLIKVYDKNIFLYPWQIELLLFLSQQYFCLIHQALSVFFPKNVQEKIKKETFFLPQISPINYGFQSFKTLNQKQNEIYQDIISSDKKNFFLFGVTGSGKTEIYTHLIKYFIEQDTQVLLLVPEIILTSQIFERITRVFGSEVIILNSAVSEATKTKHWQKIHSGQAKIIVGTRSSLFYPYKNLGCIIIDEEHDNSYISDNSPRYNAIEIAEKISDITGAKLLLASGTPKINHIFQAFQGKYKLYNLFQEYQ